MGSAPAPGLLLVLRLLPSLHGESDALLRGGVAGQGRLVGFTAPREHVRRAFGARPLLLTGLLPRLELLVGLVDVQPAVVGGRQADGATDEPVLVVVVEAVDLGELLLGGLL